MATSNEEFQIKRLDKKDTAITQALVLLFQEVFEMENPATAHISYLERLLGKPDFIVYVAMHDHKGGTIHF